MEDLLVDVDINEEDVPAFSAFDYIRNALFLLDAECDGAVTDDGVGFAGMHTRVGKRMAARIANHEPLSAYDVRWIRKSLPYYFNTQLAHIEKELFFSACDELAEEISKRDYSLREALAEVHDLSEYSLVQTFKAWDDSDIIKVVPKFRSAATSMRNQWRNRQWLSEKQEKFIAVIVRTTLIENVKSEHERMIRND